MFFTMNESHTRVGMVEYMPTAIFNELKEHTKFILRNIRLDIEVYDILLKEQKISPYEYELYKSLYYNSL